MSKVLPVLRRIENLDTSKKKQSLDIDELKLNWNRILEEFNLLEYESTILLSKLTVDQCLEVDDILVNEWLKELSIPLGDRALIVSELKKVQKGNFSRWQLIEDENIQVNESYSIIYFFPIVNLLAILFGELPDVDSLKSALELLGIMSALQFTVMITIPIAYDYSVYEAVVSRYAIGGLYGHCWRSGYEQIEYFAVMTSISIVFSFVVFILVMVYYIVLVHFDFTDKYELNVFWFYLRWGFFLCILMLTGSIVCGFSALQSIFEWNFPNEKALNGSCTEDLLNQVDNPWGANNIVSNTLLPFSVILGCSILSIAIRALYLYKRHHQRMHFSVKLPAK